jgi:dGTPase
VGWRFLHGAQPSLEAQLVNLADEMAYNAHDIDDGVRSGLITAEQLLDVALYRRFRDEALAASPSLAAGGRRLLFDSVRRMREALAGDLVATTQGLLLQQGIVQAGADAQAVRQAPPLVAFSTPMRMALAELKRFLFSALYRHEQVQRSTERARQVVAELFMAYLERPAEMPAEHAAQPLRERAVADYIAGMTDRFALREHQRLTGRALFADAA